MISHCQRPADFLLGSDATSFLQPAAEPPGSAPVDLFDWMMYVDMTSYLPDDIMVKVDRAGMAASLETKALLLNHRVVELAWKLPRHLKIRNGDGKWILKQLVYRYVPRELVDRPKMGFGVPIDHWMRVELREWCEQLLNFERLRAEGYWQPAAVRAQWKAYLAGQNCNRQYVLWNILMFQAWLEHNSHSSALPPTSELLNSA